MEEGTICFFCNKGKFTKKVKNKVYKYKEKKIVIKNYITFVCNYCRESIVAKESLKSSRKILKDHQRKVDGLLTSEEIKRIRNKFGLTQKKFSEILDIGEKNFTRYENGYVSQPRSIDRNLRALDANPYFITCYQTIHTSLVSGSERALSGMNHFFTKEDIYNVKKEQGTIKSYIICDVNKEKKTDEKKCEKLEEYQIAC